MTTMERTATVVEDVAAHAAEEKSVSFFCKAAEWAGFVSDAEDCVVDLGSANGSIWNRKTGLNQITVKRRIGTQEEIFDTSLIPTVAAFRNGRVTAVGHPAYMMYGRESRGVVVHKAVEKGSIGNIEAYTEVLRYLLRIRFHNFRKSFRLNKYHGLPPKIYIGVPDDCTDYHMRMIEGVIKYDIKAKPVLYWEQIAAAIGAGLEFTDHRSCATANIGGGTLDFAILAFGKVLHQKSYRVGGDNMDLEIQNRLARRTTGPRALIGRRAANYLKEKLGSASLFTDGHEPPDETITGSSPQTMAPIEVTVTAAECRDWLRPVVDRIIWAYNDYFKQLHEDHLHQALGDIKQAGIRQNGGGSLLPKLAAVIQDSTGVPIHQAPEDIALNAVVLGASRMLDEPRYRKLGLVRGNDEDD
jgi:rod shape-determining protein MreB